MRQPRIARRYRFEHPQPFVAEIHLEGCECVHCEPTVPPRLDAPALGRLTLGAFAFGTAIAVMIEGPVAVAGVLRDTLLWWLA